MINKISDCLDELKRAGKVAKLLAFRVLRKQWDIVVKQDDADSERLTEGGTPQTCSMTK